MGAVLHRRAKTDLLTDLLIDLSRRILIEDDDAVLNEREDRRALVDSQSSFTGSVSRRFAISSISSGV